MGSPPQESVTGALVGLMITITPTNLAGNLAQPGTPFPALAARIKVTAVLEAEGNNSCVSSGGFCLTLGMERPEQQFEEVSGREGKT